MGDLTAAAELPTDDSIQHNPTVPIGRQAFFDHFGPYFRSYPLHGNAFKRWAL